MVVILFFVLSTKIAGVLQVHNWHPAKQVQVGACITQLSKNMSQNGSSSSLDRGKHSFEKSFESNP